MSYRRLPARVYMGRAYGVRGLGRGLGQDSQGDDTAINTYLQTGVLNPPASTDCVLDGTCPDTTTIYTPGSPLIGPSQNLSPVYDASDIGSSAGCSAGYVIGDASGNCVPATQLAAALGTSAGAASLGLTPTAAAAITAALRGATAVIAPTSVVVPAAAVSTNPLAALSTVSPTVWLVGGVVVIALLAISKEAAMTNFSMIASGVALVAIFLTLFTMWPVRVLDWIDDRARSCDRRGYHNFEARFDEQPFDEFSRKGPPMNPHELRKLFCYKVYVKDVCVRCGAEIHRNSSKAREAA